jgi:hypothetical protein
VAAIDGWLEGILQGPSASLPRTTPPGIVASNREISFAFTYVH